MKKAMEMNDLMEKKLSMEELEMVSSGVEDEESNELIIGFLILIAFHLLVTAFAFLVAWGLAELIHWIKTHKKATVAAIAASGHPIAAYKYSKLSDADVERIWTEAYRKLS